MGLPEEAIPVLTWAGPWVVVALALLAAFSQLPSDTEFRERVAARTKNRLILLNDHLDRQFDQQWGRNPSEPIIPDLAALRDLKRFVDRAAAIDITLDRRKDTMDLGRFFAVAEVIGAFAFAGVGVVGFPVTEGWPATVAIIYSAVGLGASAISLALAALFGLMIDRGRDHL